MSAELAPLQTYSGNNWARLLHEASTPRSRNAHWQRLGSYGLLFVVDGSRLFEVDSAVIDQLEAALNNGEDAIEEVLQTLALGHGGFVDDRPLLSPPLQALSLAIAQKCNLGCTYCYAGKGEFGGPALNMSLETAKASVDLLVRSAAPGSRCNLAFLGGEPLVNREVLYAVTRYAAELAAHRGLRMGFSITTNGTLLSASDAEFFEEFGFAVTVSLDGLREVHDRQRPFRDGSGSFDRIIGRVEPLLRTQRAMQVSVRSTVTPFDGDLRAALDLFLGLGFHSVGFSPVLRSPAGVGEMNDAALGNMLNGMVACGLEFERRTLLGERYAFANVVNALRELHRGTHRPYPCGAGAGYMGVSATGELSACHRFVGDKDGQMGSLVRGIDASSQNAWLSDRHVHTQEPCGDCWARYLCSGGCHHEVLSRGRTACAYIRGWLHYCLQAYDRMLKLRPDWFGESHDLSSWQTTDHAV